jgi:hypothetical protein
MTQQLSTLQSELLEQESDDDAELACGVLVNYTSYDKTFIMGIKRYCSSKALPWVFAI